MLFCNIDLLDDTLTPRYGWYVGVSGGTIEYVGATKPNASYGECYDGAGKLLMCGLWNAHTHASMTLLRGYAENLALDDWLHRRVFPFEAQLSEDDIYWGAMLGFLEMLRFGTVSATDMYLSGQAVARAALDCGIKCNLGRAITCFDGSDLFGLPAAQEMRDLFAEVDGSADGRIRVDCCLHAEYTSTPKVVRQTADFVRENGMRVHLHLSETRGEHEGCKARHHATPAQYFERLGLFDAPVTAAHCVWLEDNDREILRRRGVTVAHCPTSNLKLNGGICDTPRLLDAHIPIALGTDGVASNNNHNLWEELKLFSLLAKIRADDPTVLSPADALFAATRSGAASQGRDDCGRLAVGYRADLIVLNTDTPWFQPVHDLRTALVFSAQGSDVLLTMVDGRVLYRDGIFPSLDAEHIISIARARAREIARRLSR